MAPLPRSPATSLLAAALLLGAGCAGSAAPERAPAPTSDDRGGEVITREEIEASNWRTAWDVIGNTTHLQLVEVAGGSEVSVLHRGRSSAQSNAPLLFIDGVRVGNLAVLKQVPSSSIALIRILSGVEASIAHVGGTAAGVIEITTITR